MKKSYFGPKQLLILLTITLLALMCGLIFGIMYSQTILGEQSKELSKKLDTSATNQLSPESKSIIQGKLNQQKPFIDILTIAYANSNNAESLISNVINKSAEKSGIILRIESGSLAELPLGSARTKTVNISIDNYVKYNQFYKFLTYIEKSLPKTQVISLTMKREVSAQSDEIKISNFKIAVYYR